VSGGDRGGNAPDKISGDSRFRGRFVEPGAVHRIVPLASLRAGRCALMGAVCIIYCVSLELNFFFGGESKLDGRSIVTSP